MVPQDDQSRQRLADDAYDMAISWGKPAGRIALLVVDVLAFLFIFRCIQEYSGAGRNSFRERKVSGLKFGGVEMRCGGVHGCVVGGRFSLIIDVIFCFIARYPLAGGLFGVNMIGWLTRTNRKYSILPFMFPHIGAPII